jgi:hypothetical protein
VAKGGDRIDDSGHKHEGGLSRLAFTTVAHAR